eukprot:gene1962-33375_t
MAANVRSMLATKAGSRTYVARNFCCAPHHTPLSAAQAQRRDRPSHTCRAESVNGSGDEYMSDNLSEEEFGRALAEADRLYVAAQNQVH